MGSQHCVTWISTWSSAFKLYGNTVHSLTLAYEMNLITLSRFRYNGAGACYWHRIPYETDIRESWYKGSKKKCTPDFVPRPLVRSITTSRHQSFVNVFELHYREGRLQGQLLRPDRLHGRRYTSCTTDAAHPKDIR